DQLHARADHRQREPRGQPALRRAQRVLRAGGLLTPRLRQYGALQVHRQRGARRGGDRIFLTNRVALRLEARGYYTPSTQSSFASSATHWAGTVGLSFFELGRPTKDSDQDGVVDSKYKCPDTTAGTKLTALGCPHHSAQAS